MWTATAAISATAATSATRVETSMTERRRPISKWKSASTRVSSASEIATSISARSAPSTGEPSASATGKSSASTFSTEEVLEDSSWQRLWDSSWREHRGRLTEKLLPLRWLLMNDGRRIYNTIRQRKASILTSIINKKRVHHL